MKKILLFSAIASMFVTGVIYTGTASATEEYNLIIKDHQFKPETLEIPADTKVRLVIENQDPTPEEFESYELNREKIIRGHSTGVVFIGPLDAGTYPFFGEFNMDTAKGQITVK